MASEVLSKVIDSDAAQQRPSMGGITSMISNSGPVDAQTFFNSEPAPPLPSLSTAVATGNNIGSPLLFSTAAMVDLTEEVVITAAINNFAICALYRKSISEAIVRFESLIRENPMRYMTDPVIFNLCTLYDLSFAPDVSTNKKKMLQKVASKYHIEDPMVHWRSFRLN